jgi:hypothetical protein
MVDEVERQLESAQASRNAIDSNLRRAKNLRAAVLLQAFRGELVGPVGTDETAELLLKRIAFRRNQEIVSKPSPPKRKEINKMKSSTVHRQLLEVLREHPNGMTPEALFAAANYTKKDVDRFYSELSRIADQILQEKPKGAAADLWPRGAKVILRLKEA